VSRFPGLVTGAGGFPAPGTGMWLLAEKADVKEAALLKGAPVHIVIVAQ